MHKHTPLRSVFSASLSIGFSLSLSASLLLTTKHAASAATATDEKSARTIAIKAGKLVDVETAQVLTDQIIIVKGEHIIAVGSSQATSIPAGAQIIDLSKATVLPGLIDAHTHLTGNPHEHGYTGIGTSNIRAALYGVRAARASPCGAVRRARGCPGWLGQTAQLDRRSMAASVMAWSGKILPHSPNGWLAVISIDLRS